MGLTTTADTFNPVIVDFYEQVGYLPEAILNYLVLLGWSLDDKTEFLDRPGDDRQLFARAGDQGAGQLRSQKAVGVRGSLSCQQLPLADKGRADAALFATGRAWWPIRRRPKSRAKLAAIVAAAGDRLKVFGDILAYADFFFRDEVVFDAKAFDKQLRSPRGVGTADEVSRGPGRRSTIFRSPGWNRR